MKKLIFKLMLAISVLCAVGAAGCSAASSDSTGDQTVVDGNQTVVDGNTDKQPTVGGNQTVADGNTDKQPTESDITVNYKTAKDVIAFGEKYYLWYSKSNSSYETYYIFNADNTCTYYYDDHYRESGVINLKWVETSDRAIHLFEKYEPGAGIIANTDIDYYISGPIYYSEDVLVYYKVKSTSINGNSGYDDGLSRTYYLIRESKIDK